ACLAHAHPYPEQRIGSAQLDPPLGRARSARPTTPTFCDSCVFLRLNPGVVQPRPYADQIHDHPGHPRPNKKAPHRG
ncbi:MAG: hypothetical protein K9M98_15140, partial [Cephaloticoccus sp.]|nr:hypothetical protein [Cephaloticoccus sp.]